MPAAVHPTLRSARPDWLLAALLALPVTGLLLVLPATFLEGYDYAAMHGFYREYFRATVLAGDFPWWNPYTALGRPFFADIEAACLYPPTWLVLPLGVRAGVIAGVALHVWLALWGMGRLTAGFGARPAWSWLAAVTFVLCGPVLARLQSGQLTVFHTLCWLPLVWHLGGRLHDQPSARGVAMLAIAEALACLAGSPNMLWVGNCGLVLLVAARCRSPRELLATAGLLAGSLALAAALTAVQSLSFLELIDAGNRPLQNAGYAARQGMGPTTWLSLAFPLFGPFRFAPEFNAHLGLPLLLAGAAGLLGHLRDRPVRALLLLAVTGLVLGSGDRLPVLGWLADAVPGFGAMRYPSRYAVLTALACLVAGTMALNRLESRLGRRPVLALGGLQLALLVFAAVRMSIGYHVPMAGYWDASLRGDLAAHGLFPPNGVPPRVAYDRQKVRPNSGLVQGYSTLDGFANPMLANVWVSLHREAGLPVPDFDFQELDAAIYEQGPFPVASARLVGGWDPRTGANVMRSAAEAGPRAWMAESSPATAGLPAPLAGATATIVAFTRNAIALRTQAPSAGLLVLAEPFHPGWRATIDGRAADVRPVADWMRAVTVPAGEHEVRLAFRPRLLWPGAALTLAGAALAAWLLRRRPVLPRDPLPPAA